MTHHTLIITEMDDELDDENREIIKIRLEPGTDPTGAVVTVLQALQALKGISKIRSPWNKPAQEERKTEIAEF